MEITPQTFKADLKKVIENLKEELKGLRTNQASPGMVENLMVEAYGSRMKLQDVATIASEGPAALAIQAFDQSTVKDIEKAIIDSPLGVNPQTSGTKIIIRLPPMSTEQREKYAKLASQMVEEQKQQVRNRRDSIRKVVKQDFDAKKITEDQKFRMEKEIDEITQKTNDELDSTRDKKVSEIMSV